MKKRKSTSRRTVRRFLRSRMPVVLLLLLQIAVLAYVAISGSRLSQAFAGLLSGISILASLFILATKGENAYKLTWIFWILCVPVFGGLFYVILHAQWTKKRFAERSAACEREIKALLCLSVEGVLASSDRLLESGTLRYLSESVGYPAYRTEESTYFPSAEEMLEALLMAIRNAKKYIFLEYFIIEEGRMWDAILDVLKEKAREGVLVRVLYDDVGCFPHLPKRYFKRLRAHGIEAYAFHPFVSMLSVEQNNRDHRKIAVIDGEIAFTGGVNLTDEYINLTSRFGHWKDAALMVKGGAAWAFTLIFLQMWELTRQIGEDHSRYRPAFSPSKAQALVLPYADSPMDDESVGENVYLSILREARQYVYITTPYLIISDTMRTALSLAAKSGVDVRIITPANWDKRVVHAVTRSYYAELIDEGVKIYEYTPGFIHAKLVISDDRIATVGSINFDYRSLYLHFECGALLYGGESIQRIKEDFLRTEALSEQISPKPTGRGFFRRLYYAVLRLLAPLL